MATSKWIPLSVLVLGITLASYAHSCSSDGLGVLLQGVLPESRGGIPPACRVHELAAADGPSGRRGLGMGLVDGDASRSATPSTRVTGDVEDQADALVLHHNDDAGACGPRSAAVYSRLMTESSPVQAQSDRPPLRVVGVDGVKGRGY